jgi:methylenetetrahydrofolate--tRNA-(uracil-5-)-methyltransferase
MTENPTLTIIGGGLAGCEAAWQAAQRGVAVTLYEMRPHQQTGAHTTDKLAELVCSNSLGSALPDRPSGLLKEEMRRMGSFILACAEACAVPAGGALAVGREQFAELVTERISQHPNIRLVRAEMPTIPNGTLILASGPLTSPALSQEIAHLLGSEHLYFYDALAPIVYAESINTEIAFRASRYERGAEQDGDYLNCPFTKDEYYTFVSALLSAETIQLKQFEAEIQAGVKAGAHTFFEGCLPVEIIAKRGVDSLAYGPMRPVGLTDPRTGKRPYAIVQLRQDDLAGSLYNLVGFQTNLTWGEQKRVLRLIPGLQNAEFARYGMMHRNTFVNAPTCLLPTLQAKVRPDLFFAGQITGVEGYMGNAASGLLAGLNAVRWLKGEPLLELPQETMLGALCHYITHATPDTFQPMKANLGILPALPETPGKRKVGKRERAQLYAARAIAQLDAYLATVGQTPVASG